MYIFNEKLYQSLRLNSHFTINESLKRSKKMLRLLNKIVGDLQIKKADN